MEQRYVTPTDGIEIERDDFDLVSKNAALADDRVFSELLRMTPSADGVNAGQRGVLACNPVGALTRGSALVVPSSATDARVRVLPFRAFVMKPEALAADAYKAVRSAVCMTTAAIGAFLSSIGEFNSSWQFAPALTGNRWDLLYVRIDVDKADAGTLRYTKDVDDNVASQTLSLTQRTVATLGVVQGVEATTPARPALPADAGGSYYIALAFVLLLDGHTLITPIAATNIFEVAPVLQLHRATGANSLRVANQIYKDGGTVVANEGWTPASGRPKAYQPPSTGGCESFMFGLYEAAAPRSVTLNTVGVIDDSVDFRNRLFKVTVMYGSASAGFVWNNAGATFPGNAYLGQSITTIAQSFKEDGGTGSGRALLANLNNSNTGAVMAAGSTLQLFVDMADGKLKCAMGATNPVCNFYFWIEAAGEFVNAF
jgi:hypothetical protein